jgi:hypothetical protein
MAHPNTDAKHAAISEITASTFETFGWKVRNGVPTVQIERT